MRQQFEIQIKASILMQIICSLLVGSFFSGCGSSGTIEYKPTSAGKADEVLWVMNDGFWADTVGGTVNHTFMKSYGILPQAEPEYFIRKKNFNQFNNDIIKKYRTIVLCASKDTDVQYGFARNVIQEEGAEYGNVVYLENVWAKPQCVVIITADTKDQLHEVLRTKSKEVMTYLRNSEDKRLNIVLYENGNNNEATVLVRDKYGFKIDIPTDYYTAVDNRDFTWLRKENVFLSSNIMVYHKQLEPDEIATGVDWKLYAKDVRNYLGGTYINSAMEGSYMEIESRFAPVHQTNIAFLDQEAVLTEGLWRMENDFMGGPFKNYSWFDQASMTYYMIDVFIHAPKEGKKKYMRHLDYIMGTAIDVSTATE